MNWLSRGLGLVPWMCLCVHTPSWESGGQAAMCRQERCLCPQISCFKGSGRSCREPNGMCIFSSLSRFPFYYELKIAFVAWLLSPYTKGSSLLYRKFVHPTLSSKEKVIYVALPCPPSSEWKNFKKWLKKKKGRLFYCRRLSIDSYFPPPTFVPSNLSFLSLFLWPV